MKPNRPWREFWVLMSLGFLQLCLTGAFQTVVPYVVLLNLAGDDPQIAQGLQQLQEMSTLEPSLPLSSEAMEARVKIMAPMLEKIPWTVLTFWASVLIYPVIGRVAGRYCRRPESAGLLILLSVATGQNPATVPLTLQYSGMGHNIALSLPLVISLVLFQFVALAAGILSHPKHRNQ